MRSRKSQIKRSRKDRIWWPREGKEKEKEKKSGLVENMLLLSQEIHWNNEYKY